MLRQLETLMFSIQLAAMAMILLACALASVMTALISIMFTRRDNEQYQVRISKGLTPHGGYGTGRLENSEVQQG